jgi:LPXTG-motif cell wall-anchored protein
MRVQNLRYRGAAMVAAVLVCLGVLMAGVGTAGAQQTTPDTPCLYTVSPTTLPPGGGFVVVQGSAPGSSVINVFVDGVFRQSVTTDPIDGSFSVTIFIGQTSRVAITIDDYPALGCAVDTRNQTASRGTGAGNLPRTGSDHVETTVLVALALVLVGAVLVVAVRRHEHVRGRQ